MVTSNISSFLLFLLTALVHCVHNLDYSDLEAVGLTCSKRDKCQGYRNNLTYIERSCECDSECQAFNDCCIDAQRTRSIPRSTSENDMTCMHYGDQPNTGVYAIATCSNSWNGLSEIQQECEGPVDFSDPLFAAPVTDIEGGVTYQNLYCAECNNAALSSLMTFQVRMTCEGLEDELEKLPADQIFSEITYDNNLHSWGINRLNSFGNGTNFIGCSINFGVPDYLNDSVRFCRSDLISTCPATLTSRAVRKACSEYMAVVFDDNHAYRNPHCAICNGRTVDQLSCTNDVLERKRPMSFALLLDVNQSDGDQVGMRRVSTPQCPSNHKYDPFFKKCRQLVCALPNHVVVHGKCVKV